MALVPAEFALVGLSVAAVVGVAAVEVGVVMGVMFQRWEKSQGHSLFGGYPQPVLSVTAKSRQKCQTCAYRPHPATAVGDLIIYSTQGTFYH